MKQIFNDPDGMTRPHTWAHLTPKTLEAALCETEQQEDRAPLRHLLLVCEGCRAANPWLARLWEHDLLPCTASLLEIEAACSEVQAEDLWPEIEGKLRALPGDRWLALIGSEVPCTWGMAFSSGHHVVQPIEDRELLALTTEVDRLSACERKLAVRMLELVVMRAKVRALMGDLDDPEITEEP